EVNGRVRLLISERGRDLAVLKRQRGFDQTDNPGRSVEVTDVRLHRADKAEAFLVGRVPECVGEGLHLDRVTNVSSGAMAFNILQRVGRNSCQMGSLSAIASARRRRTTTPAPLPNTVPAARWSKVRQ